MPWGIVASATGSSPHGVSEASLTGHLGRAQRDHPQESVSSSGTSSICWVWLCTRTQPCLSLSARTATPSSTSATASSGPFCRESTSPPQASGNLVQSRLFFFLFSSGYQPRASDMLGSMLSYNQVQWSHGRLLFSHLGDDQGSSMSQEVPGMLCAV